MTKTVLVPLDGSSLAEGALPTAMWLAAALGAEVHVVRATVGPETAAEQAYLDGVAATIASIDVVSHVVNHRYPAPGILDALGDLPDPMICMTTRGASGWAAALLGSVTDELLCGTDVPAVLVGPHAEADPSAHAGGVVAAVDGSAGSLAALASAADLAIGLGRALDLVATAQTGHLDAPDARADLAAAVLDDAVQRLAPLGIAATPHVLLGASPSELIVSFSSERAAALLAIGTHEPGGISARALGPVATAIVHNSRCPVLVRRAA
jgi:nucleotide-binding universal stress UspA family protein